MFCVNVMLVLNRTMIDIMERMEKGRLAKGNLIGWKILGDGEGRIVGLYFTIKLMEGQSKVDFEYY